MARLPPYHGMAPVLCLASLLASCAAQPAAKPPPIVSAPVQTAAMAGNIVTGVLVAIRPVIPRSPLQPSSVGVLAALQFSPPAQSPDATEFVIQRNDGNVAAIVLRSPASSPGATLSAANFSVGDQVELITGPQPELIHQTP